MRLCHSIISAALTQAERWEWVEGSVAKRAQAPTTSRPRNSGISPEDIQRLLRAAQADDEDMATALAIAAVTGARRGELCGLQWGDVDEELGTLQLQRAWVPARGGQQLGPLKVGDGRTVPLGAVGLAILERYKRILEDRLPGWKPEPDGWLCSMDGGTTPLRAKSLTEFVSRTGKRLDPPVAVHLHRLRHFAATQLGAAGVNPRVAADLLGHRTTAMTMDVYTDRLAVELRAAVDHLGELVAPALT